MDLVKTYRMYQKMMKYPQQVDEMRTIFIEALANRGIVESETIEKEARATIAEEGLSINEERLKEYTNAVIDLSFAKHFSDEEIENYVNLARKEDRFRHLHRVVNAEGATAIRIKRALKEFCEIPQGDLYINPSEATGVRVALINHFISNQLPFLGVGKRYITIRDIDEMLDLSYWNLRRPGKIGGKAAGMFLAYKILLPRLAEQDTEFKKHITIPESYYFNSGIFSDFIDYNGLHHFHSQKYKTREAIEEEYKTISQLFEKSSYPPDMMEVFRDFLEKVGEDPLILRSSSLLEDNFGYAFSGKYDSFFLANQGDIENRLKAFVWGLKQVHMSTFGPGPILYRRDHNLLDFDERMSVLVQKVVGRRIGDYFLPFAAGVAFSHNPFRWTPRIRKEEGIVRMVSGLGTRAVDRVGSDYPRMIPLSHPALRPEVGAQAIEKYSQKMLDVLNLKSEKLESVPFKKIIPHLSDEERFQLLSINEDEHLSPPMFMRQDMKVENSCITFDNLLNKTRFVALLKKVLKKLEAAYGRPVDMEFAWEKDRLYLLQCRTLAVTEELDNVAIPDDISADNIFFTNDRIVSNAIVRDIEYIVYVDPKAYSLLGKYEEKYAVGRVVSRLNQLLEDKRYGLFGPGRWGSNDINLGVRVGYEDINRTLILGEIAFIRNGATPEVSSGTHFFNDLVEARIVPIAIYPGQNKTIFNEAFLINAPNELGSMVPEFKKFESVVRVIHISECTQQQLLHVYQDSENQKGIGYLDHALSNQA